MQTNGHRNGTMTLTPHAPAPAIEPADPAADLDALDDCISDLDAALFDVATCRLTAEKLQRRLETIEAGHVLTIEGGNTEQRRARLTLTLNDDPQHTAIVQSIDACRARLLDAERRVTVTKERARLLRLALELRRPAA